MATKSKKEPVSGNSEVKDASDEEQPFATITVQVFANDTKCQIENFENISVGLLEKRVLNRIRKEWYQLRRMAVYEARKNEQPAINRARKKLETSEAADRALQLEKEDQDASRDHR
jgi:hypothetical protein